YIVERHLNPLEYFIRQRSYHEGSMVECYMVYRSLVYINGYLLDVVVDINMPHFWDANSINKLGKVLLGKSRIMKVKGHIV
ncbi:MAG: hypothetical protein ABSF48_05345, partial [Thermodesulfobacteriota bacterium]